MPAKRAPKWVLDALRRIDHFARFQNAAFGMPNEVVVFASGHRAGESIKVDDLVKNETKLFRDTWLLPEIDTLIRWANNEPVTAEEKWGRE